MFFVRESLSGIGKFFIKLNCFGIYIRAVGESLLPIERLVYFWKADENFGKNNG